MMLKPFLTTRIPMFGRGARVLAFLLLCFAPRAAWAILLVATNGANLSRFDSAVLGSVTTVPVTGMQSGEVLVGIDYRPGDGQLYGVGSTSRIYTLNPFTGVAVQVGSSGAFSLNGTAFGTDFNPVPDRLRQVSNTEQNLRLNPSDGTLTSNDGPLNPAGNVVAVAYSNNFAGASSTILYAIDSAAGTLGNVTAPNNGGPITTVGSLGLGTNLNDSIGFDIAQNGIAYATITTGGISRLYTINLTSGLATLAGTIGTGTVPYPGVTAVMPGPPVTCYAIDSATNNLVRFSNQNLSAVTSTPITGLVGGDTLIGLDFRPATGQLYGLGSGSRLYTINTATGAATQVGTDGGFALAGQAFGFDFNPVADANRVTSDSEQNFRILPNTGLRPGNANDTTLAYATGDTNVGDNPDVGGAAYTNNFFGAATTTLFAIDTAQNALVRQGGSNVPPGTPSPNTGQLFTVGGLNINPTDDVSRVNTGFDIQTLADGTNIAYAALTTNGTSSQLYTINLTSGLATSFGIIRGAANPMLVRALALAPAGAFEFSAPSYSVGESGPSATITINRLRGSDGQVSVLFSTANGTADTSDYTDSDQTVTFGNGVTSQTASIPLNNDSLDEPNETINLALSNPSGSAILGTQTTAVLTITDDDVFGINLVKLTNGTDNNTPPGPTVPFGSTVTFTYIVTNTGNVSLSGVTVVDDNGTAGSPADDFNATFAGGDTNGNGLLDPTETFTFTASRIATAGQYTNLAVARGTPSGGGADLQDGDLDNHFGAAPAPILLGNISTRLRVETDDNALIAGFIITGTQNKRVIVRGLGPSTGLANALADPTLELFGAGGLLRANDNWEGAPNRQEIIDSTIPPPSSFEPAILMTLPANGSSYTAVLRGFQNQTGVGLVEVYDLDQSVDSRLANISTRGLVQTGDDVMIAGFIVLNGNQKVIVRGIGPSLTLDGKLADPTLELRDGNGALIRANDNWRIGGQEADIIATTIPPANDAESAIVEVLAPGSYTAILRGVSNTTGIAVVEVYALN